MKATIPVDEIAGRLGIGKLSVYRLLELGTIPAIRIGWRWIISRSRYDDWERTFGGANATVGH